MTLTFTETKPTVYTVGKLTLYIEEQRLEGPRGELRLSASHFRVLSRLMRHPGHIVSQSDLIGEMYPDPDLEGDDGYGCLRHVLVTLRRALNLLGTKASTVIINEFGVGYAIRERFPKAGRAELVEEQVDG